ncbi:MAG: ADP-glyceromanno-heptose 6-epimerase [Planctomycetes bacterium]|nr:ADP-glyceromanno-heptose 6-epimerase [Planctomycetota bacterium]
MYIVTGGAGFVGSNLVRGLNRRGITEIVIVDDLEQGDKHRNLNSLQFQEFVDYRDFLSRLEGTPPWQKIDAILHQGACSDTMEKNGRLMLLVNTEYSKKLLAFAAGRCPFLYASSAALYGDGDHGFVEEPRCEYPLNVYAFSKFLFDRHVRTVLPTAKSQIVGLRYFNVYGPQENHKGRMASVISKFHHQIRATQKLEIFEGSERFRRDFVWVGDTVDVNLWFLDHPERSGIFNCGSGRAESFRTLADEVKKHYAGARIAEVPFPKDLEGKYQRFTRADLGALRKTGCDVEFSTLEQGVAAYVGVLKNQDGYWR